MNKLIIKIKNAFHPGHNSCYKCGRKWGMVEPAISKVIIITAFEIKWGGISLFCVDCDKIVTARERWHALDKWKAKNTLRYLRKPPREFNLMKGLEQIKGTELMEYPREVVINHTRSDEPQQHDYSEHRNLLTKADE